MSLYDLACAGVILSMSLWICLVLLWSRHKATAVRLSLAETALRCTLRSFTDERGDGVLRASIRPGDLVALNAWLVGDDAAVHEWAERGRNA